MTLATERGAGGRSIETAGIAMESLRAPQPRGGDAASPAASEGGAFECRTCRKRFPSFQALGGHRTSHTRLQARDAHKDRARRAHECAVCGLEFPMGQALGGHMRRHKQPDQARVEQQEALDLNHPPRPEDRGGEQDHDGFAGSEPRLLNLLV